MNNIGDHRLGFGLGLRNTHFQSILDTWPTIDWFEAISENFMDSGGRPRAVLRRIADRYPVALHGVSLSIGSTDPVNLAYLGRLRQLADEVQARWVSDHLCWTGVLGINSHDLLPLPLNNAVLAHVARRVHQVQDLLNRPLVLENPSTYARFRDSTLSEPEFLHALCRQTGCKLLLDVNNIYVSSFNAGTDPWHYLDAIPFEHVVQLHVAGHQHCGTHIIDTHDQPVSKAVLELFHTAWARSAEAATLVEWDGNIPPLAVLQDEISRVRAVAYGQTRAQAPAYTMNVMSNGLSTPLDFMVPHIMSVSEPSAT